MKKRVAALFVLLIIIAILVIVLLYVLISKNKSNTIENNTLKTGNNYEVMSDGTKVNLSEEVVSTKKVGNIVIEKSSIVYKDGISKLTSKVTNDEQAKDNLKFTIKFIGNDGKVIAQTIGYLGKIGANQRKYLESNITQDLTNTKSIVYEILN